MRGRKPAEPEVLGSNPSGPANLLAFGWEKLGYRGAEGSWKTYSDRDFVLRGIDLTVGELDFIIIKGRSGAGKTTLLRIMGLLEKPSRGSVVLFGR